MKNTKIFFNYRDAANFKASSGPYVLKGELPQSQITELLAQYGEGESLLIPVQISSQFKNACPSLKGLDNTVTASFDDEFDHPYHSLELEVTSEEPNVSLTSKEFYQKVKTIVFDEFDY